MDTALAIYQDLTDRATRALWLRDMDTVLGLLSLPYLIGAEDCDLLHDNEADLLRALNDYRDFLDHSGAREFHRIALWAHFDPENPDRIEGAHETYLLRGSQYVVDRYISTQVLMHDKGGWRGTENRSQVRNATCTILSPERLRQHAQRQRLAGTGG